MSVLQKRTDQKAPMHTRVKLRCQDLPPDRLAMLGSHLDIIWKKKKRKSWKSWVLSFCSWDVSGSQGTLWYLPAPSRCRNQLDTCICIHGHKNTLRLLQLVLCHILYRQMKLSFLQLVLSNSPAAAALRSCQESSTSLLPAILLLLAYSSFSKYWRTLVPTWQYVFLDSTIGNCLVSQDIHSWEYNPWPFFPCCLA